MNGYRYLVLPPEASTNWLFSEEVVFNLIVSHSRMVMDRCDYYRYRRLARVSDVDFFKYFNLTVLHSSGLVQFLNYQWWYRTHDVTNTLSKINDSRLLREPLRFEQAVAEAYRGYRSLTCLKRPIVDLSGNTRDIEKLDKELASTDDDLRLLEDGSYATSRLGSYISRLGTKLLAAEAVASSLRMIGQRAELFDSMEYAHGLTLLKRNKIDIRSRFATDMFDRSPGLDRVVELFEQHQVTPDSHLLCVPVRMLIGASGSSDRSSHDGGGLVRQLHLELRLPDVMESLPSAIEHCVRERCWPRSDYRRWLSSTSTLLGGIEALCPLVSSIHLSLLFDLMARYAPSMSTDHGYPIAAQLIARAAQRIRNDEKRQKVALNWTRWLGDVFFSTRLDDSAWGESQRDMKDWTNPLLYVPWWEGGAMWSRDQRCPPSAWEHTLRRAFRRKARRGGFFRQLLRGFRQ